MSIELAREGRLLHLILNRPEKRNALNIETCREIVAALNEANDDHSVGAILMTGKGPAFCAGMDLTEAPAADPDSLAQVHERLFTFGEWMRKPVVAAVQGPALGGGTGLAANAPIVLAADDAMFGLTEILIGLWPVLIYPAVQAALGPRRTLELALTGRRFSANEAIAIGLAAEVHPRSEFLGRAESMARQLAHSSAVAVREGLAYVRAIGAAKGAESARIGSEFRGRIMSSPDFAEGVQAFHEKRPPAWPSHTNPK